MEDHDDGIYVCCKQFNGLTEAEARAFAREVSLKYGLAQLEGDGIEIETYKDGKLW